MTSTIGINKATHNVLANSDAKNNQARQQDNEVSYANIPAELVLVLQNFNENSSIQGLLNLLADSEGSRSNTDVQKSADDQKSGTATRFNNLLQKVEVEFKNLLPENIEQQLDQTITNTVKIFLSKAIQEIETSVEKDDANHPVDLKKDLRALAEQLDKDFEGFLESLANPKIPASSLIAAHVLAQNQDANFRDIVANLRFLGAFDILQFMQMDDLSRGGNNRGDLGSTQTEASAPQDGSVTVNQYNQLFKNFEQYSFLSMITTLYNKIDNAYRASAQNMLNLVQSAQHLEGILTESISLMTSIASQCSTLLSYYQGQAGANANMEWQTLGFGINDNNPADPSNRYQAQDVGAGVYTCYPIGSPGAPSPLPNDYSGSDIADAICGAMPNPFITSRILKAYNASPNSFNLSPYSNIQGLIDGINNGDPAALAVLQNSSNAGLSTYVLDDGNDGSPAMATTAGFYIKGISPSLIDYSDGAIINSKLLSPSNTNPVVPGGQYSLVTLSGVHAVFKKISQQIAILSMLEGCATGSGSGGAVGNGTLYKSLSTISDLNNNTINSFISNAADSSATNLSSTIVQNLSQAAAKQAANAQTNFSSLVSAATQVALKGANAGQ